MKKYCIFLTVFVLTISMLTGCGCTPGGGEGTVPPTRNTMPTVPETNVPATVPTEQATVAPETVPAETGMIDRTEPGNAATDATGDIMDSTAPNDGNAARSRRSR